MIFFLMTIALLNTALGFLIAVYILPPSQLKELPLGPISIPRFRRKQTIESDAVSYAEETVSGTSIAGAPGTNGVSDSSNEAPVPGNVPSAEDPDMASSAIDGMDSETDSQTHDNAPASEPATQADMAEGTSDRDENTGALDQDGSVLEPIESIDQIPPEWLATLDEYGIEAEGLIEASAQVLRLEVGEYRDRIVSIDNELRKRKGELDVPSLQKALDDLRETNRSWLVKQTESANHLSSRLGALGDQTLATSLLIDTLENQQARIETSFSNLAVLDPAKDPVACEQRIYSEIRQLIDLVHRLRDRMFEMLIIIKKTENRLSEIKHSMTMDKLTNLFNRAGMEKILVELTQSDPKHFRRISCGLIDIDRFTRLMDQYGPDVCDRLLRGLGSLLNTMTRKNRGFDRMGRLDGQRFLALFADTGPRAALSAVERIRQTIEKTHFDLEGETIRVTAQCGVAELGTLETTDSFFGRLESATETAKREGRNCTAIDEGQGPVKILAPNYPVRKRVITL